MPLRGRDRLGWIGIPVALLAFHLATAAGYGIFRDELYYLACASHLDWGYVDHPPLSILILAGFRAVAGDAVEAIRVLPAIAGAVTVMLAASTARALGGGAFAQRLGALCTAVCPIVIALSGFYSMNAFDLVIWSAILRLIVGALSEAGVKLWLGVGLLAGLGLQNKISPLYLGAALVAGLLAAGRFDAFRTRWIWLGGALSALLFAPHLIWQVAHGWPTLEFMENARRYKMIGFNPLGFLAEQLLNAGPTLLPLWIGGLAWLFTERRRHRAAALGFTAVFVIAILALSGAKPYYLGPLFPFLFAAGGVAWERWTDRSGRVWWRAVLVLFALVGGIVVAPLTKGILPVEQFIVYSRALGMSPSSSERHDVGRLPQHFADMHGWEELAETVARVRATLPPGEREQLCIFGQNYGEAGAIDYFGPALGLPHANSAHNAYWMWGPPDCASATWIVIGDDRETLESIFETVELGATFDCDLCMPFEDDNPIWIARGLKSESMDLWPKIRRFI